MKSVVMEMQSLENLQKNYDDLYTNQVKIEKDVGELKEWKDVVDKRLDVHETSILTQEEQTKELSESVDESKRELHRYIQSQKSNLKSMLFIACTVAIILMILLKYAG